ncbi:flagellar hook capping FlgD N-terminal domain-containing protein [Occultella kanbiaonis]|uniref:flagellar hook capping FlgD N-terminal domain-containing protein n=1 Tax=Occultella kanbiaonis TaxID=2675754 RepID=UPI0012B7A1BB|nr:flagellar hook capping FlgD N-terminal domain-containing protein [Occultella kanbiaonis]
MPISTPIPPVGAAAGAPPTPAAPKQTLDSEVFLELLVTQLRNQDPSSPMDTTQMIQQTTQLASMEQLTSLARLTEESFSLQMRSAAAELLGREVSYLDADGATHTGIASAVSYADQVPTVMVGTERVALDAVSGLTATTDA